MSAYWWLVPLAVGAWVGWDAHARAMRDWLAWMAGTIILWPLALPIYLASRPLRAGEQRVGGWWWNATRYGSVAWTGFVLIVAVGTFWPVLHEEADTFIVWALGLLLFWVLPVALLLLVGWIAHRPIVERGPTGPLNHNT